MCARGSKVLCRRVIILFKKELIRGRRFYFAASARAPGSVRCAHAKTESRKSPRCLDPRYYCCARVGCEIYFIRLDNPSFSPSRVRGIFPLSLPPDDPETSHMYLQLSFQIYLRAAGDAAREINKPLSRTIAVSRSDRKSRGPLIGASCASRNESQFGSLLPK